MKIYFLSFLGNGNRLLDWNTIFLGNWHFSPGLSLMVIDIIQTHPDHHHALPQQYQQQPPQPQQYQHSPAPSATMSTVQEELTDVNCWFCSKTFLGRYAKYNLKRHLMIHRGEKPFVCPYCPHRANQKGNLKYHILSVHPGHLAVQFTTPVDGIDDKTKNENLASSFWNC